MFPTKIPNIAALNMFSASSLTAAVPNTMERSPGQQLDTRDWVSVDFQDKTIEYNPAAFNAFGEEIEDVALAKSGDDNDHCDDGSYSCTDGPWPNESACTTQGDSSRQNKYYDVWANTPE